MHVFENILLLACSLKYGFTTQNLCLLFKSMVEFIKTITCLLVIYGLNQNHCLLAKFIACFKIWFTIKTIKYQCKTVYNNTLVFEK